MNVTRIAVEDRTGFLRRPDHRLLRLLALVGLVALWELLARIGWVPALFLPSPLGVLREGWEMLVTGEILVHLSASLRRLVLGFAIGGGLGVVVGVTVGFFAVAEAIGTPLIAATFPIPKIALLPLLILWLGLGESSKVAAIALGVFFPMAISTYAGVDNVPRNLIRMTQSFNVPFLGIVANVVIPGMLPSVLAGCRISASIALILVVAAEMIGANVGIGALVLTAGNLMQTDKLMAGIVAISIPGLWFGAATSWLERTLLSWR